MAKSNGFRTPLIRGHKPEAISGNGKIERTTEGKKGKNMKKKNENRNEKMIER